MVSWPSVGALRLIATVVTAEAKNITNNRRAAFQFKFLTSFVISSELVSIGMRIQKFIWSYLLENSSVIELESDILNKMHRRLVQDFLDVVILQELLKRPLSGYDLISFVHNKFQILLSSGTVYSYLYSLERDGLVKGECAQRKRVYTLTERGKETARALWNMKDKILGLVLNLF